MKNLFSTPSRIATGILILVTLLFAAAIHFDSGSLFAIGFGAGVYLAAYCSINKRSIGFE